MRIGGDRQPCGTPAAPHAFGEPRAVHAVAGAEDVAARDALVRLDDVRPIARERRAHGARETGVAPDAADVIGIADDGLDGPWA